MCFFKSWDCCEFSVNSLLAWNLMCQDCSQKSVVSLTLPVLRWQLNPGCVLKRALITVSQAEKHIDSIEHNWNRFRSSF